ncbi:hypothetical protein AVO42_07010 [Thiomicrospira sp. XS5]|uniref:response regulator n=1 Tax=Thiomicrospira sp. XS5 TaxID=1775636 RepID=UPI000747335D|nr:response regulator [Thiomicrospira sp. XS5]KUJ75097.1 hypothetical protein AVO42_07010 [Thiomicrospira sp. XS5]
MAFNILYIEDNDPATIKANLEETDIQVITHDPGDFEASIRKVTTNHIDLLLLDFTLSSKTAIYEAPTIAQTIRTKNSENHRDLPIILISSEQNITKYYKDYTSQDLFDFSISKEEFLKNPQKYKIRLSSLVNVYRQISNTVRESKSLLSLLNTPKDIEDKLNIRVKEFLDSEKCKQSTYIASDFILNHIVKPSGLLIGKDILAARLGISSESPGWCEVEEALVRYKYTGLFSDVYERWWSSGIEFWWKSFSPEHPSLKRLRSSERVSILKQSFNITGVVEAEKTQYSKSDSFWTICAKNYTPLDPIDGFEKNLNKEPWEDKEYFSLIGASEVDLKELKLIDRQRYLDATR